MNRDPGANPNTAWPRRVAAGLVVAIGAAGCSAGGPQEIARGEQQITPVECDANSTSVTEAIETPETIRQDIDSWLCVTANEAAQRALVAYREDGLLASLRNEGPEEDKGVYGFSYSDIVGNYVSVEFGMTDEKKPNLSDLRRVRVNTDHRDDQGDITHSEATSIERQDDGRWTISEFHYDAAGKIDRKSVV